MRGPHDHVMVEAESLGLLVTLQEVLAPVEAEEIWPTRGFSGA